MDKTRLVPGAQLLFVTGIWNFGTGTSRVE